MCVIFGYGNTLSLLDLKTEASRCMRNIMTPHGCFQDKISSSVNSSLVTDCPDIIGMDFVDRGCAVLVI